MKQGGATIVSKASLIIGLIVISSLMLIPFSDALALEQSINNIQSDDISGNTLVEDYQQLGTGLTGVVETIKIYLKAVGPYTDVRIGLYCWDSDDTPYDETPNIDCSWKDYPGVDALIDNVSKTKTEYTLTLSTPLTLYPDKYYGLTFRCASGCLDNVYLFGADYDVYHAGAYLMGGNVIDAYFKIETMSAPTCGLGNCHLCEIYDTCMEAGCFWEYSLYMCQIGQCYYCAEPYEPEPEDCDAFYKCQYCMTEETCEAQLNCEWVDRGWGDKCYMKEPIMPPEQVGWEVPELENCETLSGVEKWLCEIKNFIAGIYMPSQEKVDILYNTIANFKNRFPFNYLGVFTNFFLDVRNSLGEEKAIPIKILEQEGNVSFSFWEQTTKIGGITETLKNVLIDFTSFIIFLGWFAWLISFLQRFF